VTWKQKTTIRILLLVARMLADDPWANEIKDLANHVNAGIGL
jgi:hypothetical protein